MPSGGSNCNARIRLARNNTANIGAFLAVNVAATTAPRPLNLARSGDTDWAIRAKLTPEVTSFFCVSGSAARARTDQRTKKTQKYNALRMTVHFTAGDNSVAFEG